MAREPHWKGPLLCRRGEWRMEIKGRLRDLSLPELSPSFRGRGKPKGGGAAYPTQSFVAYVDDDMYQPAWRGQATPRNLGRKSKVVPRGGPAAFGEASRLARAFHLDLAEVKSTMQLFEEADADDNGLDKQEFAHLLAKVLSVTLQSLKKDMLEHAWNEISNAEDYGDSVEHCKITLDEFFSWYVSNMFTFVSAHTIPKSEQLIYRIAKEHKVGANAVEKLKNKFDGFDADGSGEIDYGEFCDMVALLLKAKDPKDIPEERMQRFWKEIDVDGSGAVDFQEFVAWYLRYFSADSSGDCATSLYASHNASHGKAR